MFAFLKPSAGTARDRAAQASLVSAATAATAPRGSGNDAPRRLFWRAFLDWLAGASTEELEQLDRALDAFAPHDVRQVAECMSEAICNPRAVAALPEGLVQALELSGWVQLARKASPHSPQRPPGTHRPPAA